MTPEEIKLVRQWNMHVIGFRVLCPLMALGQCWLVSFAYMTGTGVFRFVIMAVNLAVAILNMQIGWRWWTHYRLIKPPK